MDSLLRWIGNLILIASMMVGAVAAGNAYFVHVDDLDEALAAAPGDDAADPDDDGRPEITQPAATRVKADDPHADDQVEVIIPANTKLSADVVAQLQSSEVEWVRLDQFYWSAWRWRWHFVAACVGLLLSAGLIRRSLALGTATTTAPADQPSEAATPETILADAATALDELTTEIETGALTAGEIRQRIRNVVDDRIAPLLERFVEQRMALARRMGMKRFAEFMDPLAEAERNINRAWSAAVDEVESDSIDSLRRAVDALNRARSIL